MTSPLQINPLNPPIRRKFLPERNCRRRAHVREPRDVYLGHRAVAGRRAW